MRFHSAVLGFGGPKAAAELMADFDGNVLLTPGYILHPSTLILNLNPQPPPLSGSPPKPLSP